MEITLDYQDQLKYERQSMVTRQLVARGIQDPAVLKAMGEVPRHLFVETSHQHSAYQDSALPIEYHQTISQPYIVAAMAEAACLSPTARVLEIGTGSGYGAAVLSRVAKELFTLEILAPLAKHAAQLLEKLGYTNAHVRQGDGYEGWREEAPFDAIIVTAASESVPPLLLEQLKEGGHLIIPIGPQMEQKLMRYTKTKEEIQEEALTSVRFVPFTREKAIP